MLHKRRITLQPGIPLSFSPLSKAYQGGSITLESFEVNARRITWAVRTDKGHIIEGRAKGEMLLPLYPEAWIALAIPVKVHVRERGNCVEFIVCIPASVTPEE